MTAASEVLASPVIDIMVNQAKLLSKVAAGVLSLAVNMKLAPEEEDMPLSRAALFLVMFIGVAGLTFALEPENRTRSLIVVAAATLILVVIYYVLRVHYSVEKEFDYKPPWWNVWNRERMKTRFVLTGFVLRPDAKEVLTKPDISKSKLLLDAGNDEALIWTEGSRTALKGVVFALYLLASAGATCVVLLGAETFTFSRSG
jgi:hypothetical protein